MRAILTSLVAVAAVAVAGRAQATPVFYTSRAAFQSAASHLTTETFASAWSPLPSVVFNGFAVQGASGQNLVFAPFFPNTGAPSLNGNGNSALNFVFDHPITEFGVDIIDFGNNPSPLGDLIAQNSANTFNHTIAHVPPRLFDQNVLFFGVIDTQPLGAVTISQSTASQGDLVYYDNLSYGVPEPPSFILLLVAAVVLMVWRAARSVRLNLYRGRGDQSRSLLKAR